MGFEQLLIANFVLPFARGVGQGTLSEIYVWLEGNGVKLGHSFGHRLLRKLSKGRLGVGDPEQLAEELATYVGRHPDASSKLTAAVLQEAGQQDNRLEVIRNLLATVFELVKGGGHPAVLPGFITGSNHLAIIDVRTSNAEEHYTVPEVHPAPGVRAPTITLALNGGPGYGPRPRVWLVTEPEDGEAQQLEDEAEETGPVIANADSFTQSMNGRLLVTQITSDEVRLTLPVVTPLGLMVHAPSEVLQWATGTDWVAPMCRVLRQEDEARAEGLEELRVAIADALG